jgi:hypothetical protein
MFSGIGVGPAAQRETGSLLQGLPDSPDNSARPAMKAHHRIVLNFTQEENQHNTVIESGAAPTSLNQIVTEGKAAKSELA